MNALLLAAALALPVFASAGSPAAADLTFRRKVSDAGARLQAASTRFLGTPYAEFSEGEGPDGVYDSDPLMRLDRLDCVTFVEQALALARTGDEAAMLPALLKIRYRGGVVGYETRNHFTEADWLPNNAAAGFLRDITAQVAGADARSATKTVSKRAWYAAKSEKDLQGPRQAALSEPERQALLARWRALGAAMPDQTVSLPYLPIETLAKHAAGIPSGTIVSLVRADQPSKPTMISHMGLVVRVRGVAYFRHAAEGRSVMDVPLLDYFKKYRGSSWPLLGLNLAAPVLP